MKKSFSILLFISMISMISVISRSATKRADETVCHGTEFHQIYPPAENNFPADMTLILGPTTAKLEGWYSHANGEKADVTEIAKKSQVDPAAIKLVSPYTPSLSNLLATNWVFTALSKLSVNTEGLTLKQLVLESGIKTPNCLVLNGETHCAETTTPFGTYVEVKNAKGERIAAVATIAGGVYGFECK